jgi:hypothetical protein
MYKDKEVKNVNNFFVNVWRKNIFDIHVTEYGTALTTILPILFQYCYKYCYSDSRNESGRFESVNNRKTVKTVMTLTWYRHF